jgi:elongation factor G
MSKTPTETLRSIALVGHGAAGKTTLAEALLHATGAIASRGSVERGSTVCDFDAQEKEAGHSLHSAIVHFAHADTQVHLIDTPGYPDFAGQAIAALAGVDTALIVVNAQTGVELMTERMMRHAAERKLCRMIVINKIDAENLDLPGLVADLRARFGQQCMLLDLPAHGAADVVEVLEHDAGEADFESVAAALSAAREEERKRWEDHAKSYFDGWEDGEGFPLADTFIAALSPEGSTEGGE